MANEDIRAVTAFSILSNFFLIVEVLFDGTRKHRLVAEILQRKRQLVELTAKELGLPSNQFVHTFEVDESDETALPPESRKMYLEIIDWAKKQLVLAPEQPATPVAKDWTYSKFFNFADTPDDVVKFLSVSGLKPEDCKIVPYGDKLYVFYPKM